VIPERQALGEALASLGADGWLLFAFHGLNPVATRILELEGLNTRRLFVLLPKGKCKLDYVKSEHGSRVLAKFRQQRARSAA